MEKDNIFLKMEIILLEYGKIMFLMKKENLKLIILFINVNLEMGNYMIKKLKMEIII